mmetsp:Transcript_25516/g.62071  ORF Transcript_25516/g.62071 Transcript_25516/m.62071 type:complete len:200 (+) Transcript_25516:116-715(+)
MLVNELPRLPRNSSVLVSAIKSARASLVHGRFRFARQAVASRRSTLDILPGNILSSSSKTAGESVATKNVDAGLLLSCARISFANVSSELNDLQASIFSSDVVPYSFVALKPRENSSFTDICLMCTPILFERVPCRRSISTTLLSTAVANRSCLIAREEARCIARSSSVAISSHARKYTCLMGSSTTNAPLLAYFSVSM